MGFADGQRVGDLDGTIVVQEEAPEEEYLPAGQGVQEVDSSEEAYVPGEHRVHEADPAELENDPSGQSVQSLEPEVEYFPRSHALQ